MIGVSRSEAEESPSLHRMRRFVTLPASSGTLLTGAGPDIGVSFSRRGLPIISAPQLDHAHWVVRLQVVNEPGFEALTSSPHQSRAVTPLCSVRKAMLVPTVSSVPPAGVT